MKEYAVKMQRDRCVCNYSEEIVTSGVQVVKTPGAQNGVRVASGAPGAAVIWYTGSAQSALQVSMSAIHCARCFWGCNLRSACNLRI